jgi:hypothetical protein
MQGILPHSQGTPPTHAMQRSAAQRSAAQRSAAQSMQITRTHASTQASTQIKHARTYVHELPAAMTVQSRTPGVDSSPPHATVQLAGAAGAVRVSVRVSGDAGSASTRTVPNAAWYSPEYLKGLGRCSMLYVVCCMLHVARCMLHVARAPEGHRVRAPLQHSVAAHIR